MLFKGYYGDAARTYAVGKVTDKAQRLLGVTRSSLEKGVEQAMAGSRLSDIGTRFSAHVEAAGFSVVREFVGHGIGTALHEEPQVPNYGVAGARARGSSRGWCWRSSRWSTSATPESKVMPTAGPPVTSDGRLSAHFEHRWRSPRKVRRFSVWRGAPDALAQPGGAADQEKGL